MRKCVLQSSFGLRKERANCAYRIREDFWDLGRLIQNLLPECACPWKASRQRMSKRWEVGKWTYHAPVPHKSPGVTKNLNPWLQGWEYYWRPYRMVHLESLLYWWLLVRRILGLRRVQLTSSVSFLCDESFADRGTVMVMSQGYSFQISRVALLTG